VRKSVRFSRRKAAAFAAVASVAAFTLTGVQSPGTAASITPHRISVNPLFNRVNINPDAAQFPCQTRPIDGSAGPKCYTPQQMQTAYGVTPLLNAGKNGAGRTIVIVDAYDNPYIQTDLQVFDTTFGLPAGNLQVVPMPGVPAFDINDANQVGWSGETSLDVQSSHAIAPGAKIVLVEAASNEDTDILAATKFAVDHNLGDVLSQSFGEAESCVDPALLAQEHQVFQQATRQGWTIFASSGDSGAAQGSCDGAGAVLAASSPASDPLVTGVGGTTLNADSITGAYLGETAWTEPLYGCNPPAVDLADVNCSGGGYSTIYRKPLYQAFDVSGRGRGVPDVSYDAGVNGGVFVHLAVYDILYYGEDPSTPDFFLSGGTSAGSPQWAAITAIGDQLAHRRLGTINPSLYALSHLPGQVNPLHDVTVGNNDVAEIGTGYNAGRHWDAVTGLGTPNAAKLLPELGLLGQLGLRNGVHHLKAHAHRR
jgi:subtilase family serine protease